MILSGNPIDYVLAFTGGVAVSFTPCVYPLIPITLGFIGASASGSRKKGFFLSLTYVTGIAIMYSLLGLFASLSGTLFGKFSTYPLTYILVGLFVTFFGLSMFDLFQIPLPMFKVRQQKKQGYLSSFVLGVSSGFIIGPCLTPVLGSILAYLAAKNNVYYGASLLFVFAYGMGLVLILAGTFGSTLVNLPKSGKWMVYIKRACAIILIIAGAYFIYNGIRRF
ncbi:MAG: sulfite exporter TauE/SafE family protein [Candidatus Omnitrophica bacterium]|nr:sulfite exporter TauE/SafE family protein [Candidatus Omnitrophota bacterium]